MADENTPTPGPKLSVKLPQAPRRVTLPPKPAAPAPEPVPEAAPAPAAVPEEAAPAPEPAPAPAPAAPQIHKPAAPQIHKPVPPRRPGVPAPNRSVVPAGGASSALVPMDEEDSSSVGKFAAVIDVLAFAAAIAGIVLVALEYFALSYK